MALITRRLNRDQNKQHIYNKLIYSKDNLNGIFNNMKELFLFALILGYSKNRREPIGKKESFAQGIMHENYYQKYFQLIALAVSGDPAVLVEEDSEGFYQNIIEEYANGGIYQLEENVLNKKGNEVDNFKDLVDYLNKKPVVQELIDF